MFDDVIVVYKFIGDLMFFVTGSQDENELILYQVLQGFYEAISLLLRYPPSHIINAYVCLHPLWPPHIVCMSPQQCMSSMCQIAVGCTPCYCSTQQ